MASHPSNIIFVDDSLPGITRKKAGTGWAYYDPKGTLIRDVAERTRLGAIALPPAYTDAWFCPAQNGHILATGYDAKGRKQYRYHPEFRTYRESEKFDACLSFGKLLPLVRARVKVDLASRELTREKAIASIVRLLDLGVVRIGNDAYTRSNKSYGATTMLSKHADVSGNTIHLRYRGKGGKDRDVELTDASLARVVGRMQDLPGQRLFQYLDDNGATQDVSSSDVNEYLGETMGEPFTAKSFRTWHASVMALKLLTDAEGDISIKAMTEAVAKKLGNTATVTRKSYIHPIVFDLLDRHEEWGGTMQLPRKTQWLTREERALLAELEDCPSAQELLAA
ncbi:DNA topoisomerase IB [Altererythrobacter sp.]|nr:DNA topoisomerase IB [Altererythrobacter sp.]